MEQIIYFIKEYIFLIFFIPLTLVMLSLLMNQYNNYKNHNEIDFSGFFIIIIFGLVGTFIISLVKNEELRNQLFNYLEENNIFSLWFIFKLLIVMLISVVLLNQLKKLFQ